MRYNFYKKKRLLIIGASCNEIPLAKRARELGAYVIITDRNKDWNKSPAKYYADKAYDISWSDIDQLENICKYEKVDGIIAGYSEFRIENLIKITSRLKLPCYSNLDQLEITRDKIKFKRECAQYNIPTVQEYDYNDSNINFPVIVKPVDRGGSIGISIANNYLELQTSYEKALELSVKKEVIIEEFIQNQTKVDFYYAIENENIELISMCDTLHAKNNGTKRVVQSAWLYPSSIIGENFKEVNNNIKKMIRGMGIKHGCIFFSAFLLNSKKYVFFECGFRLEGAHQYRYVELSKGFNYLDVFINNALRIDRKVLSNKNNIYNKKIKSIVINIYSKKGKIKALNGFEEISKLENCTFLLKSSNIGDEVDDSDAILSKVGMFSFCDESVEKLKTSVDKAYKLLEIQGESDEDLVYDKIDTDLILNWW